MRKRERLFNWLYEKFVEPDLSYHLDMTERDKTKPIDPFGSIYGSEASVAIHDAAQRRNRDARIALDSILTLTESKPPRRRTMSLKEMQTVCEEAGYVRY